MSRQQNNGRVTQIKVFGVGGAGCNAINRMIEEGVQGVDFFAVNTDLAVLNVSKATNKIVLGTQGAGGNPEVGKKAAIEKETELREALKGADMVFVTAGLGGGTGTGAAPFLAKLAKEQGSLTVGIVTMPFTFEGKRRSSQAFGGLDELRQYVDSLIVISNNKLLAVIGGIPIDDAFREADNVLRQAVQTITDLVAVPIMVNVDFADVCSVMEGKGNALIGIGMAEGEEKAKKAAIKAISSPLLEAQIQGATCAIINVTGGESTTLFDAEQVVNTVTAEAGGNLDVIWGVAINNKLKDAIIVTVIATGFDQSVKTETVINTTDNTSEMSRVSLHTPNTSIEEETEVANKNDDAPKFFRFRD